MRSIVRIAVRKLLGRKPASDKAKGPKGRVARLVLKAADIVYPTNASGNNMSVR